MKLTVTLFSTLCMLFNAPQSDAASCSLHVNCYHPDVKYTDTDHNISIYYYDWQRKYLGTLSLWGEQKCNWLEPTAYRIANCPKNTVRYVVLQASGNDAFFADYVKFREDNGYTTQWGVNNGNGYCLSTDPNDSFGGFAANCYRCLTFHRDGNVYIPSKCPNGLWNHSRRRNRNLRRSDTGEEASGEDGNKDDSNNDEKMMSFDPMNGAIPFNEEDGKGYDPMNGAIPLH